MIVSRFLANALLVCALAIPQASPDEAKIWQEFVTWLKAQADVTQIGRDRYRAQLIADGLPVSQADERMAVLVRLIPQHRDELSPIYFDKLYATPNQTRFTLEPNAFLVTMTKGLTPGKALDVAMGQGRNAVYLASKGWDGELDRAPHPHAGGETRAFDEDGGPGGRAAGARRLRKQQ